MLREIKNRWRRINVCKFPSQKNGRNVWTESIIELCFAIICERDGNVASYTTQTVRIHYELDGKRRSYTPDFLVHRKVGRPLIVEVKYQRQITAWFDQLFRIVTPIFDREGFDFEVRTERDILGEPILTNLKRLQYYSRTLIQPQHQLLCPEFFAARGKATLGETFDFFQSQGADRAVVLALTYHNFLCMDLTVPLSLNSPIWLPLTKQGKSSV
jgi:hypothetical protein